MKFLKSTLLIFYISNISCAQKNTPPIETPEKIKYTYETVIEDIDVPWGLDFINAEELRDVLRDAYNYYPDVKKSKKDLEKAY